MMFHSSSLDSNQQMIKRKVEEINAEQIDKKTRVLLAYEIKNREKEITFLNNKISMIQKEIHQTDSSIERLNQEVNRSKSALSGLFKDSSSKKVNEWAELKQMQKEVEELLSILPQLKASVTENKSAIESLTQTLKPLEEEWRHISEEKQELEESLSKADVTLSSLEQEISIMRGTRGLLYGILPDGYSAGLIDNITLNFEKCIQSYYDEIDSQIAEVKAKKAEMEHQISLEQEVLRRIRPEKISLEHEAQRVLESQMVDEALIFAELEKLKSKDGEISEQNSNLNADIDSASLQIKDIDGSIITKQNMVVDLNKKYENLLDLKRKVGDMEDIEQELKRIRAMVLEAKSEHNIKHSMFDIINNIKSDMASMNQRLKSIYESFNIELDNFDNAIDQVA
ncbi:MAG: hypothetical protein HQK64_04350 [Desulfamplus sp.]|nr:hypothetical protein [Desulfamplus sp.]